jgi:DegV family protein with EDD domain
MTVRIVTDSTADISPQQAQSLGITIIPLTIFFGEDAYLDEIELDNAGFYTKLQESEVFPRTSQPSPTVFQEAYIRLIDGGADGILSVHISSKLSGTYQCACAARDTLPDDMKKIPLEIIDSQSISVGMSQAVLQAAREARMGAGLKEIKDHLLDQLSRTRILCVLDTLEYARRGGRLGSATAVLGNLLNIKPIISLKDGAVIAVERPRTRSKAYTRIAQLVIDMGKIEQLVIGESNEEVGQELMQALTTIYQGDIPRYKLGAVLGAHGGPGIVGVAVISAGKLQE